MPDTRTPELLRREITMERAGLADAVEGLRLRLGEATDVKALIGARARVLAPASFAAAFVLSGGIGATMRFLARRGRDRH